MTFILLCCSALIYNYQVRTVAGCATGFICFMLNGVFQFKQNKDDDADKRL